MDKYEYKVRAEEIKNLIAQGDYAQAAEIADTIDWRRVKSVMMLCAISDLYKINRRYEDARDLLLLAYEHRPGGRNICYALCELSIKTEEFVQAVEYYKEFVQVAPKDPARFILQYKLYEAQDVSLEERIEVLEELKRRDFREKWVYELAYLYHRVGLGTRCVEECDELITMLGDGKYVIKAMELKMLHQPLSPEQQEKYDHRFDEQPVSAEEQPVENEFEFYEENDKSAEDMPDENADSAFYGEEVFMREEQTAEEDSVQTASGAYGAGWQENAGISGDTVVYEPVRPASVTETPQNEGQEEAKKEPASAPEELDIQVKTVDVGEYNTLNLQAELARGLREILDTEQQTPGIEDPIMRSIVAPMMESDTESLDYPEIDEVSEDDLGPEAEEMEGSEVFFGETGNISDVHETLDQTAEIVMEQMRREVVDGKEEPDIKAEPPVAEAEPPKEIAHVLAQESDGQISLVIPENGNVAEKQITGQMSIEDVLAEWERMKQENEEKRKEDVRQRVLRQTGRMFTEFEEAVRDGLLEKLENGVEENIAEPGIAEPAQEPVAALSEESEQQEAAEAAADDTAETQEKVEAEAGAEMTEAEPDVVVEVEKNTAMAAESKEEPVETISAEEAVSEPDMAAEPEMMAEAAEPVEEIKAAPVRPMTSEEKELYAPFIQSKAAREQIIRAIDGISLAAYTGNVILTGEEGMDTLSLAKNMVKEVQATDSNFSGKTAKISGQALNKKDVAEILGQLQNGALIIQRACDMDEATVQDLCRVLQQESFGIVVLMEDERKLMNHFLQEHGQLLEVFTARVDVEALSNDTLVAYGRQYAREKEYSIDELGVLALHTRIEERQTIDHAVTTPEVKGMVDDAIHHANRKTMQHFFDILFFKRYDREDMIVLTEKDFA